MTKAQDRTEAWIEFHENLPEIVAFLKYKDQIVKDIVSLKNDIEILKQNLHAKK